MGGIELFESRIVPGEEVFTVQNDASMANGSTMATEEEWRFPSDDRIDYTIYRLTGDGREEWMTGSVGVGRCLALERLTCMSCRETGDQGTSQLTGLSKLLGPGRRALARASGVGANGLRAVCSGCGRQTAMTP